MTDIDRYNIGVKLLVFPSRHISVAAKFIFVKRV